jgi:hypothetical protein
MIARHVVTAILHNGDEYRKEYESKGLAMAAAKQLRGKASNIAVALVTDGNL